MRPIAKTLFSVAMGLLLLPALGAAQVGPSETGLYIVHIPEASLATYQGGRAGLEATHPGSRGEVRLDARSPASLAYLAYLDQRLDESLTRVELALGRAPQVLRRYRAISPGLVLRLSQEEANRIAGVEGIAAVVPDVLLEAHTDAGPEWIGAFGIWDGTDTGGLGATKGEGVIVGIVDSGTNMDHPSFAEVGGDGYTHVNPFPTFLGWCNPANPNFDPMWPCNGKLIGAWDFADALLGETDGPEDSTSGHGTHVGSTAAGNTLLSPAVSGVAPRANMIGYDIALGGSGSLATICSASDQAILDGVHVLNNSFSMGGGSPWSLGSTDRCFLDAVAAGIYFAVSAGNSGPGVSTIDHTGPWMMTVGNSTHDRVTHENTVSGMSGGVSPPADITADSRTTATYGPATVVYAGNFVNGDPTPAQCLQPFPPGTWTSGEIVLCDRGAIARVLKCQNVAAGGAGGCILANVVGSGAPVADAHVIPAAHVDLAEGDALRAWLAGGGGHTATLTGSTMIRDPANGDRMSAGSSRGPSPPGLNNDVIKPDITAPGSSIYAAVNTGAFDEGPPFNLVFTGPEFANFSGTSMASPHTAGAGALLIAVHPDWTPPEVQSALMMTAVIDGVRKENNVTPADPFDMGGGRVDLSQAARAGLVLHETFADFLAADPATGGDPKTLNLAGYQNINCNSGCSFERTFRSTASADVTWAISAAAPTGVTVQGSPSAFTIASGATRTVTFHVNFDATATTGSWLFALITLTPDDGSPELTVPVAITLTGTPSTEIFADGFESGDTSAW